MGNTFSPVTVTMACDVKSICLQIKLVCLWIGLKWYPADQGDGIYFSPVLKQTKREVSHRGHGEHGGLSPYPLYSSQ
jgi:hypothetical protein